MRLVHAVLAGLLIGGAVGWWWLGHPGYETTQQRQERAVTQRLAFLATRKHKIVGALQRRDLL